MNFKSINVMSMNLKLINLVSMNFKSINIMSMNFKSINLKLVVLLVPCILFYAFLYFWNLIVKKINWPNNLIYITTQLMQWVMQFQPMKLPKMKTLKALNIVCVIISLLELKLDTTVSWLILVDFRYSRTFKFSNT